MRLCDSAGPYPHIVRIAAVECGVALLAALRA
jgi:hypothetical protein